MPKKKIKNLTLEEMYKQYQNYCLKLPCHCCKHSKECGGFICDFFYDKYSTKTYEDYKDNEIEVEE